MHPLTLPVARTSAEQDLAVCGFFSRANWLLGNPEAPAACLYSRLSTLCP